MTFRSLLLGLLVAMAAFAPAQEKPVCDLLTAAEVADLLGRGGVEKRSILGPNDCTWVVKGHYSFSAVRLAVDAATGQLMVDAALKNVREGEGLPPNEVGRLSHVASRRRISA